LKRKTIAAKLLQISERCTRIQLATRTAWRGCWSSTSLPWATSRPHRRNRPQAGERLMVAVVISDLWTKPPHKKRTA
jgi:hypothetical protein